MRQLFSIWYSRVSVPSLRKIPGCGCTIRRLRHGGCQRRLSAARMQDRGHRTASGTVAAEDRTRGAALCLRGAAPCGRGTRCYARRLSEAGQARWETCRVARRRRDAAGRQRAKTATVRRAESSPSLPPRWAHNLCRPAGPRARCSA